jgi:hypothetical protein
MKTLYSAAILPLLMLGLIACGSGTSDPIEKPEDSKADAIGRLCEMVGKPADCDICQIQDWYGDGECDDFCKNPDPDCETTNECSWDKTWPVASVTSELRSLVVESLTVTIDNSGDLSGTQARQIWTAVEYLVQPLGDEDFDIVFEIPDGGDFTWMWVESKEGPHYDWVRFYMGDTEVGLVFETGTTDLVARVSDGDIMGCKDFEPKPGCSWDKTWPVASVTSELRSLVVESLTVTIDSLDLSSTQANQIWTAVERLVQPLIDDDFDIVFEIPDGGTFTWMLIESEEGPHYDWVRFYMGDTEVGLVFETGTTDVVARVSDGDIMGCDDPED